MNKLICAVYDPNKLSSEILETFIKKTPGLALISNPSSEVDVLFIDAELNMIESLPSYASGTQIVVISSDKKFANSFFSNQISDFVNKSKLTYPRFLEAIDKVKKRSA